MPAVIAPGSTGNKVDFRLVDVNSNPMSGQTIVVNGVNGVDVTGTTDNNGSYSYSYTAPATGGSLDIRATAGGVSKTQTVLVQSGTGKIPPADVAVQSASLAASPSVVPVNTGSTSNRSELRALFLGDGNAPVERRARALRPGRRCEQHRRQPDLGQPTWSTATSTAWPPPPMCRAAASARPTV